MRIPRLFLIFVAVALIAPIFRIHAQSDAIKQAREAVTESVTEATRIETAYTSESERFTAKHAALESILSLSKLETEDLQNKLTALSLNDEAEKIQALRTKFTAALDSYLAYLKNADKTLAAIPDLAAAEKLAGDLQEWKETIYNPEMQKIINFTLAFQNRQMLLISDTRFAKIAAEIKRTKLPREKAVTVKLLLDSANNHLEAAHTLNEDAITTVRAYLTPNENKTTDADTDQKDTVKNAMAPAIETSKLTVPNIGNEKNALIISAPTPRELVTSSVKEIRATYENFLKIAELLNKRTGK